MSRYAPFFVIFGAALWGVDGILLRPSLYSLPVPLVVLVESSLIVLLLTPYIFYNRASFGKLTKRDWIILFLIGLVGGAIGTMAITRALFYVNFVNLSIVVLLQKLQPVFAILLAAILLKERPQKQFYLWAGLAILGAYLMTFGLQSPNLETGDKTAVAAIFAIIAAIAFASGTVLGKMALQNVSHQTSAYLRFVFTAFILIIIATATGDVARYDEITQSQFIVFVSIALISGVVAMLVYYYGLKRISASVATICELAFPLTAVLLEFLVRDNILSAPQWLGVGVLLLSIIFVTRK
ncbi:MAG: DMT family transporter [Calditrichia bacterium]